MTIGAFTRYGYILDILPSPIMFSCSLCCIISSYDTVFSGSSVFAVSCSLYWTSILSVFQSCHNGMYSSVQAFPFLFYFLVALTSTNEQNHVLLSWGILVCHDDIDKSFPCEGTYLSWGSSSTLTPWCWWFQNSFSVSSTSAPTAFCLLMVRCGVSTSTSGNVAAQDETVSLSAFEMSSSPPAEETEELSSPFASICQLALVAVWTILFELHLFE